jgi:hypothetical protein
MAGKSFAVYLSLCLELKKYDNYVHKKTIFDLRFLGRLAGGGGWMSDWISWIRSGLVWSRYGGDRPL